MYVFVGWASLALAENATLTAAESRITPDHHLGSDLRVSPEYELFVAEIDALKAKAALPPVEPTDHLPESDAPAIETELQTVPSTASLNWPDKFNADLLAVGVTVPSEDKMVMYSLNRRLPSCSRLSVAAAFRNYLIRLHDKYGEKITLIGFDVQQLLDRVAYACAVQGVTMPTALWRSSNIIELSAMPVVDLIKGHAEHLGDSADGRLYLDLLRNWAGPAVSAQRSMDVSIATSILLGLCEVKDGNAIAAKT